MRIGRHLGATVELRHQRTCGVASLPTPSRNADGLTTTSSRVAASHARARGRSSSPAVRSQLRARQPGPEGSVHLSPLRSLLVLCRDSGATVALTRPVVMPLLAAQSLQAAPRARVATRASRAVMTERPSHDRSVQISTCQLSPTGLDFWLKKDLCDDIDVGLACRLHTVPSPLVDSTCGVLSSSRKARRIEQWRHGKRDTRSKWTPSTKP